MKNLLFWSLAAASVLFGSCSKDDTTPGGPQPGQKMERFYLSDETTEAEANPASRASFADGYKIAWEAGDVVAINSGDQYAVQQDAEGRWYVELPVAESYTVYYPAALCGIIEKGLLVSKIPYDQTYRAGTFDPAALLARAVAKRGEKLVFKYMCSVIKFTLKGNGTERVSTIELSTANTGGERFCAVGTIETEADGTAYLAPYLNYARKLATLNAGNAVLSSAGTDFYMTLIPTTFSRGFSVTVTLSDGRKMTKTGGVGQTAARGRILAMPAIPFQ